MRTTIRELVNMLMDMPSDAEVVLQVRGNKTTDYSEQRVAIEESTYGDVVVIKDKMSE